jgi:hypothetical protein
MATAPGLNERPVLRWWCRCFPDSLAARVALTDRRKQARFSFIDGIPDALKDQQKMALVYHAHWESRLPLTLSLADFGILFCPLAAPVPRAQYQETRRLLPNRPCRSFLGEESYSKGRLRVSNGLCKDSMMMQSTTPSNSDF